MDFFRRTKKLRVRVAALIENEEKNVLLIQQKKKDKVYWLLPGGGVEFGETAEVALRRELREEIGVEINSCQFLFINESIDPDGKRHLIQLVFQVKLKGTDISIKDKALTGMGFFSTKDIIDMDIRPDIKEYFSSSTDNRTGSFFISSKWVTEK